MVAFQTLFLGLVFGFAPVRVMVGPPVASVQIVIDGAVVGTVTAEPWEVGCGFGPAPLPHELVAIGLDKDGKEVARARQLVNVPRPQFEAKLAVQLGETGKPSVARLTWSSMDGSKPTKVSVNLDGTSVPSKDPTRIELSGVDLTRPHFVAAEVSFPKGAVARAEAGFGGEAADAVASELTAFPVVLRPGATLPPPESLTGWFLDNGQPLRVVAVEEGYTDTYVVFDQDAAGRFLGISRGSQATGSFGGSGRSTLRVIDNEIPIQPSDGGHRMTALWAVPRTTKSPDGKEMRGLFSTSIPLDRDVDELRTFLYRFGWPTEKGTQQALANAVATAGMQAAAVNRRRAVVLIVGEAPPDLSSITPAAARAYLESINVPLFVWTTDRRISGSEMPGWGRPDDASTDLQLMAAMGRLDKALKAQRIVWLAGSHLPSAVTISPKVRQLFYARGVVRQERPKTS